MRKVLVIRSAATRENSISNKLIDAYLEAHPDDAVVERDLDADPLPHITSANVAGIGRNVIPGEGHEEARALQDTLIDEVFAAELLLIGVPLYNLGMPSTLKSWFDYISRAGKTFQYGPNGLEGLLAGRRAILMESRGGNYDESQDFPYGVKHASAILGLMGINDIDTVVAQGVAYGPEAAEAALAEALPKAAALD